MVEWGMEWRNIRNGEATQMYKNQGKIWKVISLSFNENLQNVQLEF